MPKPLEVIKKEVEERQEKKLMSCEVCGGIMLVGICYDIKDWVCTQCGEKGSIKVKNRWSDVDKPDWYYELESKIK